MLNIKAQHFFPWIINFIVIKNVPGRTEKKNDAIKRTTKIVKII